MKRIFKVIVTMVFVVSYLPLHAQSLTELAVLDGLQSGMMGQQNSQQNITEDQTTDESEEGLKKEKPPQDLIDKDYSYSGDNSFAKQQKPNSKLQDKELEYFGYDFFSDVPSTFAQLKNTPIPSDYTIVPGDIINISLFGNENRQMKITVSRNGDIFFPEIGPIYVMGLTLSETKQLIQNKITNQKLGTEVNVTLESLGSINIFVLGEAFMPGMFTVSSLTTITNAVLTSGGVKKGGSLRNIQLKRNGELVSTFDFYDLMLNGDISDDQRLMSGDVVFIPPVNKTVAIQGEVSKPGIYELKENEDINDLIEIAGNLKPKADSIALEVVRVDKPNNGFSLFKINLDKTNSKKDLYNGDLIKVYPVLNNIKSAVLLTGHIEQPGFYPWYDGLRIGDIITPDKLLSMTDLQYVLIKREDQKTQRYTFLQADLEQVFSNKEKESESNIKLNERDEILFLPSLLRPEQIKTTMLQDKFKLDENNQMVMEDEWKSLTYLRKSLMEEKVKIEEANPYLNQEQQNTSMVQDEIGRHYEYSVYDYCTLPESVAIQVTEASGFRVKKSIDIEELDSINEPEDILTLKMEIENERIKNQDISEVEVAFNITDLCRKQLIDPLLDLITRQN
ncbi:MAG: SLBB domain-containing protein, partial [Pelagibacterales bacterium]|nr:SLBB domain-containing protein [Pelagibacterales bacterium]